MRLAISTLEVVSTALMGWYCLGVLLGPFLPYIFRHNPNLKTIAIQTGAYPDERTSAQ